MSKTDIEINFMDLYYLNTFKKDNYIYNIPI